MIILIPHLKYLFHRKNTIHPHKFLGWKIAMACTEKFFCDYYNNSRLIKTEFTHNAIPMNVNDLKEVFQVIQNYKYINGTLYSIERYVLTLLTQHFYGLYLLNIKHRKVHSIMNRYFKIESLNFLHLNDSEYAPLFVINTGGIRLSINQINGGMRLVKKRFTLPTKYEIVIGNSSKETKSAINSNNNNNIINKKVIIDNSSNDTNSAINSKNNNSIINNEITINKKIETVNNNNNKESVNGSNSFISYFRIYCEYILILLNIVLLVYLCYNKNKSTRKYKKLFDKENNDIIQTKIIIV